MALTANPTGVVVFYAHLFAGVAKNLEEADEASRTTRLRSRCLPIHNRHSSHQASSRCSDPTCPARSRPWSVWVRAPACSRPTPGGSTISAAEMRKVPRYWLPAVSIWLLGPACGNLQDVPKEASTIDLEPPRGCV